MKVLMDTNIFLDFFFKREPFFQQSARLFHAIGTGRVIGYATATTLTDIFYIARRQTQSIDLARKAVFDTLVAVEICPVSRAALSSALRLGIVDFEDAVQVACALEQELDAIITRDSAFESESIPVLSIENFFEQLEFGRSF
jgi:predicted nucleic acid-binding protein